MTTRSYNTISTAEVLQVLSNVKNHDSENYMLKRLTKICDAILRTHYPNELEMMSQVQVQTSTKTVPYYNQKVIDLRNTIFASSAHPVVVALLLCPNHTINQLFMKTSFPKLLKDHVQSKEHYFKNQLLASIMSVPGLLTDAEANKCGFEYAPNIINFSIWLQRCVYSLRCNNPFDQRNLFYLNRYFGERMYNTPDEDIMKKLLDLVGLRLTPFPYTMNKSPIIEVGLPYSQLKALKNRPTPYDKFYYKYNMSSKTLLYPILPYTHKSHKSTLAPVIGNAIVISVKRLVDAKLVSHMEEKFNQFNIGDLGTKLNHFLKTTANFNVINPTRIDIFGNNAYTEQGFRSQKHSVILRSRQDVKKDTDIPGAHVHGAFAVHRTLDTKTGGRKYVKPYRLTAVVCARQHDNMKGCSNGSITYLLHHDKGVEPDADSYTYQTTGLKRKVRFYRYDPILMINRVRATMLQDCGTDINAHVSKKYFMDDNGLPQSLKFDDDKPMTIRQEIEQRGILYIYSR